LINWLGMTVQGDLGPLTIYTSKRGRKVFYDQAPPKTKGSPDQLYFRNKMRQAATIWRSLRPVRQGAWQEAAERGGLRDNGYHLLTAYVFTADLAVIRTLERQTGIQLCNANGTIKT